MGHVVPGHGPLYNVPRLRSSHPAFLVLSHSCPLFPSPQGQPASPLQDPTKGYLQMPTNGPYSDPASHSGSDVSLHRIKNLPGYTTPVFKGKEEQRAKVQENVAAKVRVSLMPAARPNCGTESFLLHTSGIHPSGARCERGPMVLCSPRNR